MFASGLLKCICNYFKARVTQFYRAQIIKPSGMLFSSLIDMAFLSKNEPPAAAISNFL
jgi:hypothetical protein